MAIKVTILGAGSGVCSLTGREADGITVSFDDGTVRDSFLSWRAFRQLLALKTAQGQKPEAPRPAHRAISRRLTRKTDIMANTNTRHSTTSASP